MDKIQKKRWKNIWKKRKKWITGVVISLICFSLLLIALPLYLENAPMIYVFFLVLIISVFIALAALFGINLIIGDFKLERRVRRETMRAQPKKVDLAEGFKNWEPVGNAAALSSNLGHSTVTSSGFGKAGAMEERRRQRAKALEYEKRRAAQAIKKREDVQEHHLKKEITVLSKKVPKRRKGVEEVLSTYINSTGMRFKPIPRGDFIMGDERWPESSPLRKVTIGEPFYMTNHPVTQEEWEKVMGTNPSHIRGRDLPVVNVSYDDCLEFIEKLNKLEGTNTYQLPTEAQWEYAARAGSTGRFCFGDDIKKLRSYGWVRKKGDKGDIHPVGLKEENQWGLLDVHGNVWEWCHDNWHDNYYGAPNTDRPWIARGSSEHILRGGSYKSKHCECAYRKKSEGDRRSTSIGFRVAMVFDPLALLAQGSFSM